MEKTKNIVIQLVKILERQHLLFNEKKIDDWDNMLKKCLMNIIIYKSITFTIKYNLFKLYLIIF